jgi:hypothetical protein
MKNSGEQALLKVNFKEKGSETQMILIIQGRKK